MGKQYSQTDVKLNRIAVLTVIALLLGMYNFCHSKEIYTINALGEKVTIEYRFDKNAKLYFIRDFTLNTATIMITKSPAKARIFSYTFMSAYELGQSKVGLIDLAVGIMATEISVYINTKLLRRNKRHDKKR